MSLIGATERADVGRPDSVVAGQRGSRLGIAFVRTGNGQGEARRLDASIIDDALVQQKTANFNERRQVGEWEQAPAGLANY